MEVVQLDDPLEAGLQVAILFEHPLILGADGLLDSDDLAAGRTVGFRNSGGAGCCRCVGPVLEDRQGPLQLPHGADDGHDLDGSAALAMEYVRGRIHTNGIENFWSLVKRAIHGTYVSIEPFHVFRYLDEQAFRFNNRGDNDRGRFLSAIRSVVGRRLTYAELTGE